MCTLRAQEVAPDQGQGIDAGSAELDLFVFDESAHEFGARVLRLCPVGRLLGRQQHAALDLDQHRRHQQVFAGQLEVVSADLCDVFQVLACDAGQRDVEDVEVLLADEVQQQVQRAFESLEKDLERVRRDVQVMRHPEQRLAIQSGHRYLVDHLRGRRRCLSRQPRGRCRRTHSAQVFDWYT
jgi:hypothetical protein